MLELRLSVISISPNRVHGAGGQKFHSSCDHVKLVTGPEDPAFTPQRQASGHLGCICRPQSEARARAWREAPPVTAPFAVQAVSKRLSRSPVERYLFGP